MHDALVSMGWDSFFERQTEEEQTPWTWGRVAAQHRTEYRVLTAAGECAAELSGRFRHAARGPEEWPAVGDWVGLQALPEGGRALIQRVLARKTAIARKAAGATSARQVLAANVDTLFIVTTPGADLNMRRIERYLTLAWESGAEPVVLLNKADLHPAAEDDAARIRLVAHGVPVHAVSAMAGLGLECLSPFLGAGKTAALLGSSGVGKSTLVNALAGSRLQATGTVGDDTSGRHTTTHRQLAGLPSGGWLVDTPGMRELGLSGREDTLGLVFEDLGALMASCRFRDCRHEKEPGCAVHAALADGSLDAGRWEGYQKLRREEAWQARRSSVQSKRQDKWKKFSANLKQHPKFQARGE